MRPNLPSNIMNPNDNLNNMNGNNINNNAPWLQNSMQSTTNYNQAMATQQQLMQQHQSIQLHKRYHTQPVYSCGACQIAYASFFHNMAMANSLNPSYPSYPSYQHNNSNMNNMNTNRVNINNMDMTRMNMNNINNMQNIGTGSGGLAIPPPHTPTRPATTQPMTHFNATSGDAYVHTKFVLLQWHCFT